MTIHPRSHRCDQNATQGCKGLCPSQRPLFLLFGCKKFRNPCDGGNEFHTHTDKRRASKEHEYRQCRSERSSEWREGVNKNAGRHDAFTPETIDQPATEQTKYPSTQRSHPQHSPHPLRDVWMI